VRRLAAALTALVALIAAPPAAASSIVFVKRGTIYRAVSPAFKPRVIRRAPGVAFFQSVTQDDRGRVWAVHYPSRDWIRLNYRGNVSGRPFATGGKGLGLQYDLRRNLPGYVGPLNPQASPDGRLLAYWAILENVTFINPHPLPGQPTHGVEQTAGAGATFSSRDESALPADAQLGELGWPSFLPDGTVVLGAITNLLKGFGVWFVPPDAPAPQFWFNYTSVLRIADPEVTRRGDLMAAVVDKADGTHQISNDDEIALIRLNGPPPAQPTLACSIENPNGKVEDVSWAPDGRRIAWADKRGVWIAAATLTEQGCRLDDRRLLARGASSPDWGPR
jgi:hypothetical protein